MIARSVDRRSLERGGATHGRVTAWAITHKEVGGRGVFEERRGTTLLSHSFFSARIVF